MQPRPKMLNNVEIICSIGRASKKKPYPCGFGSFSIGTISRYACP